MFRLFRVTNMGLMDNCEEMKYKINEVKKMCGGMKKVCKSIPMSARRKLYEGLGVPIALSGTEVKNMGAAENKTLSIGELRCLRSICGVTRTDRMRNKEPRRWGYESCLVEHSMSYCEGFDT